MERQVNDHEIRIRDLERKIIELGYSINANGKAIENIVPKVDNLIQSDLLTQNLKNALKQNEKDQWTRREKYMALWTVIVTTIGPLVTIYINTR